VPSSLELRRAGEPSKGETWDWNIFWRLRGRRRIGERE
jgi:hypothetical protein